MELLRPLTNEQITGCIIENNYFNKEYFDANVKPILSDARKYYSIDERNSQTLNAEMFHAVYVTSDIHSDVRKFIELLVNADIVTIPAGIDLYSDDIYNPELYTQTIWNKPGIAVIVLGDIIDGRRGEGNEVNDVRGQFELLLHIFLYNMKIKALEKNAMLAFTFGNHDYHSLIQFDTGMIQGYTPNELQTFFGYPDNGWIQTRQHALLPFYEVHPLFMIRVHHGQRFELYGIHGGFHNPDKSVNVKELIDFQKKISALDPNVSLTSIVGNPDFDLKVLSSTMPHPKDPTRLIESGGMWSRVYENADACSIIEPISPIMIVVGHCPTWYSGNRQELTMKENSALYAGCQKSLTRGGRGCVVLSCNNRLAHVDVSMSAAFHGYDREAQVSRDAEMLVLKHDAGLKTDERYYNIVERFSKTGGTIEMYRAAAVAGGGRRKVTRRKVTRRKVTRRKVTRRSARRSRGRRNVSRRR
jgi:hypothetical protein